MKKYVALTVFCLAIAVAAICMGNAKPEVPVEETADISYSQTV